MEKIIQQIIMYILITLTVGTVAACATAQEEEALINRLTITPTQARNMMRTYPDAVILDVRTQDEFDQSHIPGATLLPDYMVSTYANQVLPDFDALILVYCRSGRRSLNTAKLLVSMGYTNVYDFGGIIDWPYERE